MQPCNRSTPDLFVELVILSSSSLLKRDRLRVLGLIPPPREYRASRVIIGFTMHVYTDRDCLSSWFYNDLGNAATF